MGDRTDCPTTTDMDPVEFRAAGRQAVDQVAHFFATLDDRPVQPRIVPGQVKSQFPTAPPRRPEPMPALLVQFWDKIASGLLQWNSPRFFGYFPSGACGPAILGELLAAATSTNAMLWKSSPAATEVQEVVVDWLRQMVGLPATFSGVLLDTASTSTLSAIAAAREQVPGLHARTLGLAGRPDAPRLRLYTSEHAHSSVEKAAFILGVGQNNVVKVRTDEQFRMDPAALERAIVSDLRRGSTPFCIVATVGTTSATSIDPVPEVAAIAERFGLWLHVDAAYGGMAAIVPEHRRVLAGVERASSVVINPHKWGFQPIDCSAFFVKDPSAVKRAFSVVPEYLKTSESDANNLMDWGPHLSHRFRALKLLFTIQHFGADGMVARVREHVRLGQRLHARIARSADFEVLAPAPFSTVCFRARPRGWDDEDALNTLNTALMNRVNDTGQAFLSHTKLNGRFTIRFCVGNIRTEARHVDEAWELIQLTLRRMVAAHAHARASA